MPELSLSLWLPIGRANFFSGTAKGWLDSSVNGRVMTVASQQVRSDPEYVPHLQASVLRRLLEVLPKSLGYQTQGYSNLSGEADEAGRPIDVTMTLAPTGGALAAAGVTTVTLFVDEHGFYTFTAVSDSGRDRDVIRQALLEHASAVFGGNFNVDRLREYRTKGYSEGAAAVRRYNGLSDADPKIQVGPPKGALSFFQLNTLVEGLCNDTLSPAVFFEQFQFIRKWTAGRGGATIPLLTIGDVIKVIAIEADARQPAGQVLAMHHFLAVTARESLQKLKWSVESVRRSLLDEMMGVLHRQSRLIQLDLGASPKERTPELAIGATESQLRGYVMLISAKLPLVINVHELAQLAIRHVEHVHGGVSTTDLHDLRSLLDNWKALLNGLDRNVRSLESAIEQAWMEKLLYEQEQSRSEQEAMAEIERSRRGRPNGGRSGERAYNSLMLIFTIMAVVLTIQATDVRPGASVLEQLTALWPIIAIFAGVFLLDAVVGSTRRVIRERRGASESYSYEFAFRIDERTDPRRVFEYLNGKRTTKVRSELFPRKRLRVTRRGGGRIERVSTDTTLVKFHSVVTFKVTALRYARFEVVHEVLARKVSDQPRYILRQTRVFGDSPKPLASPQIIELVRAILTHVGAPLVSDGNLEDLIALVAPFYSRKDLEDAEALYGPEAGEDAPIADEIVA